MCIVNLNDTLTGESAGGIWTQLTGPDSLIITNDTIDTNGITPGTYTFEYCIDMCDTIECATSTIVVKENYTNFTYESCINNGSLNIINIINAETGGNPTISTLTHSITYAPGSDTTPFINLTNYTINTIGITPRVYTLRVTRTDISTYCPCYFDVTFDFESCLNLVLTPNNLCTFSWSAICGNSTVLTLEKIVNGVWTTIQTVNTIGSYTLIAGTFGTFRLKSVFTGCTVYSPQITMTCPCSECDYTLSIGTALGGLDGSGASICNVYYVLNNAYINIPLNYPYHIRTGNDETVQLQTDLQTWENNNGIGIINVNPALCLPQIGVTNTCTNYSLVRGTSGQCTSVEADCNCIDYVAGFIGSAECSNSLDIFTMDIYPEKVNECDIIINRARLLKQKGYTTSLQKLVSGVWTTVTANVLTLPINTAGTHHIYRARLSDGGLGSGTYRTIVIGIIGFNVPSFVNNLASCVNVVLTGCNCPECTTIPTLSVNSTCNLVINNNGCTLAGWQFLIEYSATQFGSYTLLNTFSNNSSVLTTTTVPGPLTNPGWYRVVRQGLTENCGSITSLPIQFVCPCSCVPIITLQTTPTCLITWNISASGGQTPTTCASYYTRTLERLISGVWTIVTPSSSTFHAPTVNGQYRIRLSRAGCPDIISNTITVNCVCDCNTSNTLNYTPCGNLTWVECSGYTSTLAREVTPGNWVTVSLTQPFAPTLNGNYRVTYSKTGCLQFSNIKSVSVEYSEITLVNDGWFFVGVAAFNFNGGINYTSPNLEPFNYVNIGGELIYTDIVDWINSLNITYNTCQTVTARMVTVGELASNCLNLSIGSGFSDPPYVFILRYPKGTTFTLTLGNTVMTPISITNTLFTGTISYPCITNP